MTKMSSEAWVPARQTPWGARAGNDVVHFPLPDPRLGLAWQINFNLHIFEDSASWINQCNPQTPDTAFRIFPKQPLFKELPASNEMLLYFRAVLLCGSLIRITHHLSSKR